MDATYLNTEILKAEKRRLEVFIGVLIAAILLSAVLQFVHYGLLKQTFRNPYSFYLISVSGVFMILLFVGGRIWVTRVERSGSSLPKIYFWLTIIIEVSIPACWLVIAAYMERSSALLDSPIIFIYFLLIIVSSLHLDFYLSFSMGLMISVFMFGYTYWVNIRFPMDFNLPFIIYYVRSFMYLMAGFCAGFVARELKKRIVATYDHIKEKELIEGLFNQQVSREVVEALKEKRDFSARLNVTILFLDIRSFTERVQHLSPEEVNHFQNDFFSPIIEIVNKNEGIVSQIMGDGMMAIFGAPVTNAEHYLSGWNAVQQILDYMQQIRIRFPGHRSIDIGLGMHCGEVLVGNIGNDSRRQFSVSGTPVIIASRIEQLNKELDSTFLMSRSLFDRLKEQISYFEEMGKIKIKGLDEELEIVKIL